jgi:hypothetical protein
MPAFVCPQCAVLATKERDGAAIKISYDYAAWAASCPHSGMNSLLLCPKMRPVLQLTAAEEPNLVEVCDKSADNGQ